jgi:hypothetical protein
LDLETGSMDKTAQRGLHNVYFSAYIVGIGSKGDEIRGTWDFFRKYLIEYNVQGRQHIRDSQDNIKMGRGFV